MGGGGRRRRRFDRRTGADIDRGSPGGDGPPWRASGLDRPGRVWTLTGGSPDIDELPQGARPLALIAFLRGEGLILMDSLGGGEGPRGRGGGVLADVVPPNIAGGYWPREPERRWTPPVDIQLRPSFKPSPSNASIPPIPKTRRLGGERPGAWALVRFSFAVREVGRGGEGTKWG